MKRLTIGFLASLLLGSAGAQVGVIVRQHQGSSSFYYTTDWNADIVEQAITDCDPNGGDTLILPGGTFLLIGINNNLVIDRPVVLLGAGYNAATAAITQPTVFAQGTATSNGVVFADNSDNSKVEGVRFNLGSGVVYFSLSGTQNVTFRRCDFSSVNLGPFGGGGAPNSQIHFEECLIGGSMNGNNATGVSIENCIFKGASPQGFFTGGLTMRNCIVHNWTNGANSGCSYYNNIFLRQGSGTTISEASSYYDNLFVVTSGTMTQGSALAFVGNDSEQGLAGVFNDVTSVTTYSLLFDYGIPAGSPANALDAGIYEGNHPWKPDGIPFIPHWEDLQFAPQTTQGGLLLNVTIEAEAQQY